MLHDMEEVVQVSVPRSQGILDLLLEFSLGLLLAHLEHQRILSVLDVVLLELLHVGDNHQLQQVDEHVSSLSQNLERLAALYLEVIEGLFIDLLLSRGQIQLLFVLPVGRLRVRQVMDAVQNLTVLIHEVLAFGQANEVVFSRIFRQTLPFELPLQLSVLSDLLLESDDSEQLSLRETGLLVLALLHVLVFVQ